MTDQQDQAALNGLVDDCYPDGWPWEIRDIFIVETWPGYFGIIWAFVDNKPIGFYVKVAEHPDFIEAPTEFKGGVPIGSMPLAGTWVEGRLRELIGEAFWRLEQHQLEPDIWIVTYFIDPKNALSDKEIEGPTPITALIAALRVLKQKEVSGGQKEKI